jgi:hypothetical protein
VTARPELSKRAQALLERIECGEWYKPHGDRLPAAMAELEAAGLVTVAGRVEVISAAYVPTSGYTPCVPERFAKAPA